MMKDWDTIIIGAGLGGLTAAAKLVKAGKRVLVLEKNLHFGGTAYTYQRNGFSFPMGPLGFSNPQTIQSILHSVNQDIYLVCDRIHYSLRAFGLMLCISLPFPQMVDELTRHFPEESNAIKHFFLDVDDVISSLQFSDTTSDSKSLDKKYQISVDEYLSRVIKDWRLQYILGSLGTRKPYTSFPLQAAMWNIMGKEGIWYPRGGFKQFCDSLAQTVTGKRKGTSKSSGVTGVIRLGTAVEKIQVDLGRVTGVVLADGTVVTSESVISNADYKSTFLNLLGPNVSPDWYNAISKAKQAGSIFQVCLGVDLNKVDLSIFRDASRIIYRRNCGNMPPKEKTNWNREEVDPDEIANQEIEVSYWSKDDEKLAPQGSAVIVIRTEAPYEHFSKFRLSSGARVPHYHDYKTGIAHALISEVRRIVPGLGETGSTMDVATPITFADRASRSQGAVAGWSWEYQDTGNNEPKELVLTPIKGLYMAGYQAFSALFMGGVPTAIESGYRAAEAVLKDTEPISEIRIPGVP